jgi:hypothetical protein
MASPRRLAYKDIFVWLLQQVVSDRWDDCDDFADRYIFPDMTTQVPLVLYLSQEEWTTLYSAVMTGADLSYPDTSHDVEYLFLQSVICSMNQFCAAMIDCLQNDPDVWAALQTLLAENGVTGGVGDPEQPLDSEFTGENLLPAGYICTDDKAFGMALAVVESINDATTEVLQAIEILTNPVEIAAELGDNVPGIGALSTAGDIARWIQDAAHEAYNLAWSTVVRDELACLLWCDFKQGCQLSFDTVWDIYLSEAGGSPPASLRLEDWLAWLITLPFTASLSTVATISLMGLLAMRYGGSFGAFQLGIQSMETVIDLAQDDSSNDWSIVCDPCATTWCYIWLDGSITDMISWPAANCDPEVTASQVIGCNGIVDAYQQASCQIDFGVSCTLTKVTIQVDNNTVRGAPPGQYWIFVDGTIRATGGSEGLQTHVLNGNWPGNMQIIVAVRAGCDDIGVSPGPDGGYAYIYSIKAEGSGANPMGADNC